MNDVQELSMNIKQAIKFKKSIADLTGRKKELSNVIMDQLDKLNIEKFETDDGESVTIVNKFSFEKSFSTEDKESIENLDAQLKSAVQDAIAKCEAQGMIAELKIRYPVFSTKSKE